MKKFEELENKYESEQEYHDLNDVDNIDEEFYDALFDLLENEKWEGRQVETLTNATKKFLLVSTAEFIEEWKNEKKMAKKVKRNKK